MFLSGPGIGFSGRACLHFLKVSLISIVLQEFFPPHHLCICSASSFVILSSKTFSLPLFRGFVFQKSRHQQYLTCSMTFNTFLHVSLLCGAFKIASNKGNLLREKNAFMAILLCISM